MTGPTLDALPVTVSAMTERRCEACGRMLGKVARPGTGALEVKCRCGRLVVVDLGSKS
jgi:hypothetical protein